MPGPRQYDVVRFDDPRFPLLVVVQSNRFAARRWRIVAPLVPRRHGPPEDRALNPVFVVDGDPFVFDPLDLASVPVGDLGPAVANLADRSDAIIRALDEVLSRAWS